MNPPKKLSPGQTFGWLTVVKRLPPSLAGNRSAQWLMRCRCGKKLPRRAHDLTRAEGVLSCGCYRPVRSSKYAGAGDITGPMFAKVIYAAQARGLVVEVDAAYCWGLFIRQEGRCALSGAGLFISVRTALPGEARASLDRIDNDKGYIAGNLQWLHPTVNFMKRTMAQSHFIEWCKRIAEKN